MQQIASGSWSVLPSTAPRDAGTWRQFDAGSMARLPTGKRWPTWRARPFIGCWTRPDEMTTLYKVAHNAAKIEAHEIESETIQVMVHRKGATRAFGPGRPELPEAYRAVGQPVLVGGTMGTSSYILKGTRKAMEQTFGSALHGAGRTMSRRQASKRFRADQMTRELAK